MQQERNLQWKMMENMRRLNDHMERRLHPFCTRQGITSLQLSILMTLHHAGPQTVSALARRTCMAGANNSTLCKRLEKDGFVRRERDPADERQVRVSLTGKGAEVVEKFGNMCKKQKQMLAAYLTEEETRQVVAGIEKLLDALEKYEQGEAE